ncbi:MAG: DMT family transporter [Clostridium sp.]|uniref:DMT family transporter n=1 Tax=Clostridium sp. TaxID=1506 RepID=UPI002FC951EB
MFGIIFSIISGIAMSFQGVFNTKLGDKIGIWETNTLVQVTGLIITLIITAFFGKGDFRELQNTSKIYMLGGVLGVIIVFTVMMGIGSLGPTYSIAIILVSQLIAAAVIDYFGLFGCEKLNFTLKEYIGVAIMIIGIIVFKWKR